MSGCRGTLIVSNRRAKGPRYSRLRGFEVIQQQILRSEMQVLYAVACLLPKCPQLVAVCLSLCMWGPFLST
jgi:hypothetical protein